MSWILGTLRGQIDDRIANRIAEVHPPPLHLCRGPHVYVAAGGIDETCRGWVDAPGDSGGVVVGLGLRLHGAHCELIESVEWRRMLEADDGELDSIDGHFAAVRWHGERIWCRTDRFGLRQLYVACEPGAVSFSTRLDWLSRVAAGTRIDPPRIGSFWFGANQFSHQSVLAGVERLAQGSRATGTVKCLNVENRPWAPHEESMREESAGGDPTGTLGSLLTVGAREGRRLSLGLSGGLDSRHLLAILHHARIPFAAHVFGDAAAPDARIAQALANELGVELTPINHELPQADACIAMAREYAAHTCATTPASAAAKLGAYQPLRRTGSMVVDGGFGEIGRRVYYRRMRTLRLDLRRRPAQEILRHLRFHRAEIFAPDVRQAMLEGFLADVRSAQQRLADAGSIPSEALFDVLAVRYRLPNFFAHTQARLDEQVLNYMPYAQPSYVRAVISTPQRMRRGGRLYRRTIRRLSPMLATYPLAKPDMTYPFALTGIAGVVFTAAKTRFTRPYQDALSHRFLHRIKTFVLDTAHSDATAAFGAYDMPSIRARIDRFYAGESALAREVDWWLAFELWRQAVSSPA